MWLTKFLIALIAVLKLSLLPFPALKAANPENTINLELKDGLVVIELRPDLAHNHVAQIKKLVRAGFYDGIVFHRVIAGFMAQTGDPTGTGTGGSELPDLAAEFSAEKHLRGVASMARSQHPNSANSQFFIVLEQAPWLDKNYTIWGKVISGMEYVDNIRKGHPRTGIVDKPDKIISMKIAADVK